MPLGEEAAIDEALEESFPASDAPSWTPTHAGGPRTSAAPEPLLLRDVVQRLHDDVHFLSDAVGERNDRRPAALVRAASFVETRFREIGLPVKRRPDETASNIEAVILGDREPNRSIVIGAHYDTAPRSPGADDNATGVAALLALARALVGRCFGETIRLVAFVNEEPPHTRTSSMGSVRYLDDLRRSGPRVDAMVSLEMLGVYRRRAPRLAVVGGLRSFSLVRRVRRAFVGAAGEVGAYGVSLPLFLPGVRSSDHWSFAKRGIPAVMLTDMGPLRSARYHTPFDTEERVDFDRLGAVAMALPAVIGQLNEKGNRTARRVSVAIRG